MLEGLLFGFMGGGGGDNHGHIHLPVAVMAHSQGNYRHECGLFYLLLHYRFIVSWF